MSTREELEAREDVKAILAELRTLPTVGSCELRAIETPVGLIVLKGASTGQWAIAKTQIFDPDPSVSSKAQSGLMRSLIVYPDAATLNAALAKKPAALDGPVVGKEFQRHIGAIAEEEGKG
jgi:hypothetical protein